MLHEPDIVKHLITAILFERVTKTGQVVALTRTIKKVIIINDKPKQQHFKVKWY